MHGPRMNRAIDLAGGAFALLLLAIVVGGAIAAIAL